MAKVVNAWNEWDPLKRVIVGTCINSCQPRSDVSWSYEYRVSRHPAGPMPRDMLAEAEQQMNGFCSMMEKRGIVVDRPVPLDFTRPVCTPDWVVDLLHGCMPPRDVILPVGNEILECTMSIRARWFEYLCYRPLLEKYFEEDPDFLWVSAPKPRLRDETYEHDYWHKFHNVWTAEEREARAAARQWQLTEKEPLFDAADGMRLGRDVIWQASAVSNAKGIDWLRRHLARKDMRLHVVHFANTDHPWHIDVLLVPLRPGLCVYNPDRPNRLDDLAEFCRLNDWELLPAARPRHLYDMTCGVIGERKGPQWISMNTFSLDPKTICVEAHEVDYIDQLDGLGFEVVPVPFEKVYPFGGGLHCSTVEVYREGGCEDYFPRQLPGF